MDFINNYHSFHDSYILDICYDIQNSKITMLIDTYWSGTPILKEDGTYETNRTQVNIYFNHIKDCTIKSIMSYEYIDNAYLKYITLNNNDLICFASHEENPLFYIVAEEMEYEEIKNK